MLHSSVLPLATYSIVVGFLYILEALLFLYGQVILILFCHYKKYFFQIRTKFVSLQKYISQSNHLPIWIEEVEIKSSLCASLSLIPEETFQRVQQTRLHI